MTQLHRGMGGAAPQPTPLRRSYPHQPERRLVEDIAFRVLAADNRPIFRTISDFPQDPFEEAGASKVGRVALYSVALQSTLHICAEENG
jgi:hypothetical protein